MQKEYEAKTLLTKDDVHKIHNSNEVELLESYTQTNYYIDTVNEYYKNNNAALRIREKNNSNQLTLKIRSEDGNDEYNFHITDSVKKSLLQGDTSYLQLLDLPLFHTNSNVHSIAMTTLREKFKFNDFSFELDTTTFVNTVDYELELEDDSLKQAYEKMHSLLDHFNITFKKSSAKIARYHLYNPKF